MLKVVVATHGYCFDGLASAALFTRFRDSICGTASYSYRSCGYGLKQTKPEGILTGDENAILDFRFCPAEQLTWYFDHHRTAFSNDTDKQVFQSREDSGRYYFDADYTSCTQLIADVAKEHFQFEDPKLEELIRWADIVDSAGFESAEQAINRQDPIKQLVSVVEHYGDDRFLKKLVPRLLEQPLVEVAQAQDIQDRYRPIGQKFSVLVERVRSPGPTYGQGGFG